MSTELQIRPVTHPSKAREMETMDCKQTEAGDRQKGCTCHCNHKFSASMMSGRNGLVNSGIGAGGPGAHVSLLDYRPLSDSRRRALHSLAVYILGPQQAPGIVPAPHRQSISTKQAQTKSKVMYLGKGLVRRVWLAGMEAGQGGQAVRVIRMHSTNI